MGAEIRPYQIWFFTQDFGDVIDLAKTADRF